MSSFENYQSPFSWRYGSPEMRRIWGEENKRRIWRRLWVAMAEAQIEWNLVTPAQLQELKENEGNIDIQKSLEIEKRIHHDLMAELKVFAEQCTTAGGIIHLGATSMDIKDNAEVLQIAQSLDLVLNRLRVLLGSLADCIEQYAATLVMAFTHLQPAEPTTLGYRLANFGQDLLQDYHTLNESRKTLKGKGFKGAVGNAASYQMLYGEDGAIRFEKAISQKLELPFYPIATQTYTRKQDYSILTALSSLAATAYKFAFDLRLLQSETIGELAEPFEAEQVGSSAMPFKRNPILCEKIDSLARSLSAAPLVAWNNYAHSLLERTLDDSANRRSLLPESFLSVDEILLTLIHILENIQVKTVSIQKTIDQFGPFSAVERILMAVVQNGANRQEIHEKLRQLSMKAWEAVQSGANNPLVELVLHDQNIMQWITPDALQKLFDVKEYTGRAERLAREMAQVIKQQIA
ncbi:MAG: adenylosuccinate lyase [Anaerolineaceae bacterium]|nr:adenylosuccinate lyase [Anaerolineaceae bacterium]